MSTNTWITIRTTGTLINVYHPVPRPPIAHLRLQIQSWETLSNGEKRSALTNIVARHNPATHGLDHNYQSLIGKTLTVHFAQNPNLPGLNLLLAAECQEPDPPDKYLTETRQIPNEKSTNAKKKA